MRSLERATGVERAPSRLGPELESVLRRLLTEAVRIVESRETLQELLVARGEAIVSVVVGRPESAAGRASPPIRQLRTASQANSPSEVYLLAAGLWDGVLRVAREDKYLKKRRVGLESHAPSARW